VDTILYLSLYYLVNDLYTCLICTSVGTLVDTDTPTVNEGTKVTIYGRVMAAVIVRTFVKAVTPVSVETSMTMAAPTVVDTLAATEGEDACVNCACEEDCDDAKTPLLVDLVIVFKALPLLKCMHKRRLFSQKKFTKNSC